MYIFQLLQTWLIETDDYQTKLFSTRVSCVKLTSLNTDGNMEVMICLSQGALQVLHLAALFVYLCIDD